MGNYAFQSSLAAVIICLVFFLLLYKVIRDIIKYHKALKAEQDGEEKKGYVRTTGHFTGQFHDVPARIGRGYVEDPRKEFEIEYLVDGEKYTAWYSFYPAEPPDIEGSIAGVKAAVSYDEKKPYIFILDEIFWDVV